MTAPWEVREREQREKEVRDRVRRIETRLTKLLRHMGFDEQGSMPEWKDGRIEVPSVSVTLKDVLAALPPEIGEWEGVAIMHKGETVCVIMKGD